MRRQLPGEPTRRNPDSLLLRLLRRRSPDNVGADYSSLTVLTQAGNVYVTLVNSFHMRLLLLQRKALELDDHRACVESQFVTVCLDEARLGS